MTIRVLIVDDDASVREALATAVAAAGDLSVAALAADGSEALERLAAGAVNVIVMDIAMPGMTGVEAAEALRARGDHTPIVFYTSEPGSAPRVGGSTLLAKSTAGAPEVIEAIRDIASGGKARRPLIGFARAIGVAGVLLSAYSVVSLVADPVRGGSRFILPAVVGLFAYSDLARRPAARIPPGFFAGLSIFLLIASAPLHMRQFAEHCADQFGSDEACTNGYVVYFTAIYVVYFISVARLGPARPSRLSRLSPLNLLAAPIAAGRRVARNASIRTKILTGFVLLPLTLGTMGAFGLVALLERRALDAARAEMTDDIETGSNELVRYHRAAHALARKTGADRVIRRNGTETTTRAALLRLLRRSQDVDVLALMTLDGRVRTLVSRDSVGTTFMGGTAWRWRTLHPPVTFLGGDPVMVGTAPVGGYDEARAYVLAATSLARALDEIRNQEPADLHLSVYDRAGEPVASAAFGGAPPRGVVWPPVHGCTEYEECRGREAAREPFLRAGRDDHGRSTLSLVAPWTDIDEYLVASDDRAEHTLALTVHVSAFNTPFLDAVKGARIALAAFLGAMIAVLLVAGRQLLRVVLRQVAPLQEATAALAGGSLPTRVPVLTNDELGDLSRRFNTMAEQLQARTTETDRLYRELSDALASKEALFRHFAHELRTPLQVIRGNAELIAGKRNGTKGLGEDIVSAADDMAGLVDEILDLVRLEAGRAELTLEPTDLAAIVEEMQPTIDGLANEAGVRATVELPTDLPHVMADERRIKDVLRNLISNAAKYTPEGGGIGLRARAAGRKVMVEVWDTGIGIPRAAQAEVFLPFTQVEGVSPFRGQPSSGLGLAIAATIVDAHGATLRLTSAPGDGSTFSFALKAEDGS